MHSASVKMHSLHARKLVSLILQKERALFPSHFSRELRSFFLSISLLDFAVCMVILFEPIYLYTLGYPIWQIMLYYGGVYVLYFFLLPLGGKFVKRRGFSRGIIFGSFFFILYFSLLLQVPSHPILLYVAGVVYAIEKTFFWVGYHADLAFFGQSGERGREVGDIALIDTLVSVVAPLIGGSIIHFFGFPAVFILSCTIILFSTLPLVLTKEVFVPKMLSYRECLTQLWKKENRHVLLGYFGFGEEIIVLTVWPIFIFAVLRDYLSVGSLVAFSTLITAMVILYTGWASDKMDRRSVLRTGVVFTVIAWCMRIVVSAAPLGVAFVDFFSRSSRNVIMLPLYAGLYEHASRTSVVRTVLFFEMAQALGKIIVMAILALTFYLSPDGWSWAFALGALCAMMYLLLNRQHEIVSAAKESIIRRALSLVGFRKEMV